MQLPHTDLAVRQQQRGFEERIRIQGMVSEARMPNPLHQRLMLHLGEVLVSVGQSLQKRYEPALYLGAEARKQATSQTSV